MEDNTEDLTTACMLGKYDGRKESQAENSRCSDSTGSQPKGQDLVDAIYARAQKTNCGCGEPERSLKIKDTYSSDTPESIAAVGVLNL